MPISFVGFWRKIPVFESSAFREEQIFAFLDVRTPDVSSWTKRLQERGVIVLPPRAETSQIRLHTNETLLRRAPEEIARAFSDTLA